MAATVSFISLESFLTVYLLSICLLCSSNEGYASEGRRTSESQQDLRHTHTVQLSSLLPSSVCKSSTNGNERKSSLKIVHKHGPCFEPNGDKAKFPSQAEILLQDQARVKSIQSRLSKKNAGGDEVEVTEAVTIPAEDGRVVGIGSYIVTVGLGTPKKELSLLFDTGSDLTWVKCGPCLGNCQEQKATTFDPASSTTYANISCSSTLCDSLASSNPGIEQSCIGSACVYGIQYLDGSSSVGFLSKETLALSSDVFANFLFGCGQDNGNHFDLIAGLLGLGRAPISVVSQTAQKYNELFSYCLPSSPSSTGYLTFGNGGGLSNAVKFTPLSTLHESSTFYGLDIIGLSVGGQKLPVSNSVFSTSGAVIDSGTTITHLPPAAYTALRTAFRTATAKYPLVTAPASSRNVFDTCYDFSNYSSLTVPTISFFFNGGVEVSIDVTGFFFEVGESKLCFAFTSNKAAGDIAIIGNVQQRKLEVVYDAAGGRVGFAPNGCS